MHHELSYDALLCLTAPHERLHRHLLRTVGAGVMGGAAKRRLEPRLFHRGVFFHTNISKHGIPGLSAKALAKAETRDLIRKSV